MWLAAPSFAQHAELDNSCQQQLCCQGVLVRRGVQVVLHRLQMRGGH